MSDTAQEQINKKKFVRKEGKTLLVKTKEGYKTIRYFNKIVNKRRYQESITWCRIIRHTLFI